MERTIYNVINPIETDSDFKRAWLTDLSDGQIDDPMHTTLSEDKRDNYGNNADVLMKIAKSEIKGLIAEKVNRIFVEGTQAEIQNQVAQTLVNMLQLGNNAASNGIRTGATRLIEKIVIKLFSHRAAGDVVSECLERWSKSFIFMNAIVEQTVCSPLFIPPVARFIRQHVSSAIDECRSKQV